MRARGMYFHRMPLFVWSVTVTAILLLLSLPVLAGAITIGRIQNIHLPKPVQVPGGSHICATIYEIILIVVKQTYADQNHMSRITNLIQSKVEINRLPNVDNVCNLANGKCSVLSSSPNLVCKNQPQRESSRNAGL